MFNGKWHIDFYSFWDEGRKSHITTMFKLLYSITDEEILPYEGNEHLVGTTDEPEEEIIIENGEYCFGAYQDDFKCILNWRLFQFDCIDEDELFKERFGKDRYFDLAIRLSDFTADMDELRKHILCVKNGKIVRYRWQDDNSKK